MKERAGALEGQPVSPASCPLGGRAANAAHADGLMLADACQDYQ